ncbi:hypothetical protein GCM10027568_29520 [Humibacter soli]
MLDSSATQLPHARIVLKSETAAEVEFDGSTEQVMAASSEALRDRVVESVRLRAASYGQPIEATIFEGGQQWPLAVHPDGSVSEPAATAEPVSAYASPVQAPTFGSPAEAPTFASPVAASPSRLDSPAFPPVDSPSFPPPVGASDRRDVSTSVGRPTVDDLLGSRARPRGNRATTGWQGAVRRATGGVISPAPSRAEKFRSERTQRVQRRFEGSRTIVVLNPKGGAHKTTTTLLLAATFGTLRGGSTLAWDNNETRGTLGWRAQNTPHHRTAVDLLEGLDNFANTNASLSSLDAYVRTQVEARFDVLASDEDAAASSMIDAQAFDRLHHLLAQYYRLIIIDTGNNMRASNWDAAVAAADQLVIVSTIREDTAASAAWLLDGLREKGFGDKVDQAVTILASPSAKPDTRLRQRLVDHFSQLTASIVQVPYDNALVDGGPIEFDALSEDTRDAWLTVAATIADRL